MRNSLLHQQPYICRQCYKQLLGTNTNRAIAFPFSSTRRLASSTPDTNPTDSNNATPPNSPKKRSRTARLLLWNILWIGAGYAAATYYKSSSSSSTSSTELNPTSFTPYTLVSKEPVSSTSSIFTLRPTNAAAESEALREVWRRAVWSVQIKQPQLQIARAYTPLPPEPSPSPSTSDVHPEAADDDNTLRLLIRKEHNGEVSGFLHRLSPGAKVELRGPSVEYDIPEDVEDVLFLAGGTGIAPAMQVLHALGQGKGGEGRMGVRVWVLWACRKREDCAGGRTEKRDMGRGRRGGWRGWLGLDEGVVTNTEEDEGLKNQVVRQLEEMKERFNRDPSRRVDVRYFVDEESTFIQPDQVAKLIRDAKERRLDGKKVVLISGPDGFIQYWAGAKHWQDGREVQGRLGGVLSSLDLTGWNVWKL